jgi:nucleoid DNA-binding protein
MTKTELIQKVSWTTNQTSGVVSDVLAEIIKCIQQEGSVRIKGFGLFRWKTKPARVARNPKTGAEVYVPQKDVLTFKASKGE